MAEKTPEARLLVVDDEPSIRELLTASLRFAGFEVVPAADGAEALKLAEQGYAYRILDAEDVVGSS